MSPHARLPLLPRTPRPSPYALLSGPPPTSLRPALSLPPLPTLSTMCTIPILASARSRPCPHPRRRALYLYLRPPMIVLSNVRLADAPRRLLVLSFPRPPSSLFLCLFFHVAPICVYLRLYVSLSSLFLLCLALLLPPTPPPPPRNVQAQAPCCLPTTTSRTLSSCPSILPSHPFPSFFLTLGVFALLVLLDAPFCGRPSVGPSAYPTTSSFFMVHTCAVGARADDGALRCVRGQDPLRASLTSCKSSCGMRPHPHPHPHPCGLRRRSRFQVAAFPRSRCFPHYPLLQAVGHAFTHDAR
ncbi:hypothetical protein GY45DRAFT_48222 [Cubamyces sp. BRFM 1775]|nr:hypothetical protein GY45DRAFT_48222 [Cubamyces sp. BRFM 1775]